MRKGDRNDRHDDEAPARVVCVNFGELQRKLSFRRIRGIGIGHRIGESATIHSDSRKTAKDKPNINNGDECNIRKQSLSIFDSG